MWFFLCPKEIVQDIHEIDLQRLRAAGIRGIITDLDNTLVPWNDNAIAPEVLAWIEQAKEAGFKVCIVSNNNLRRGEGLSEQFDVPAVWQAVKPRRGAFRKALEIMALDPTEAVVVGDQVFTDVLGGNRLGLHTILVAPLNKREFIGTKFMRQFEKAVLFGLRKKGYIDKCPGRQ